jgi:hypothetical protein
MKNLLPIIILTIIVLIFSACSTYISSTEQSELEQAVRRYFTESHPGYAPAELIGTRITRSDENYRVVADTNYNGQQKTVLLIFKRLIDPNGFKSWQVIYPSS